MPRFSSHQDVLDFLFKQLPMYQRLGQKALRYDLVNINRFMSSLGDPHKKFKSIHVAGTNGKGSTSHLISAVFQDQGFKTGLYTSPHYIDFRERIKIDGNMIEKSFMVDFMNEHFEVIESIQPSYFELSVALAFSYFAKEKVDIAIIEVGLGGRLDSTNVISPLLSVITNISLEHTQTLGDSVAVIAREKGGIIKDNIPVVIGEKHEESVPVFKKLSSEKNARIHFAEEIIEPGDYPGDFELKGPFHTRNLRTALASIRVFCKFYPSWGIDYTKAMSAFDKVNQLTAYIGRWMILSNNPLIIADGAHNEGSWKQTSIYLEKISKSELHIVLGFAADKDIEKIFKLLPKNAKYYYCAASIQRAMDAKKLSHLGTNTGLDGEVYANVTDALDAAKMNAKKDDIIFVGGSIYLVGELLGSTRY